MADTQYTVRGVPEQVDASLKAKAREEGKSLNQVVLEILREAVAFEGGERIHTDLDHLAGTWVEDPDFDRAIADLDQVDPSKWA